METFGKTLRQISKDANLTKDETCSRIFTDKVNAFLQSKKTLLVDEANCGRTSADVDPVNVFSNSDLKMCQRTWKRRTIDDIKVENHAVLGVVSFDWS